MVETAGGAPPMKYDLIDGEIHHRDSETGDFWPVSLDEAAHIAAVMNAIDRAPDLQDLIAKAIAEAAEQKEPT
jgi:hypothetical protein